MDLKENDCSVDYLKVTLSDKEIEAVKKKSIRQIKVDLELTAGGKVINRRVYSPVGLRDGHERWTKPKGRPFIKHHNMMEDAIGRVIGVKYEETPKATVLSFIKDKTEAGYNRFRTEMFSNSPKRVFEALHANDLLANKEWPGICKVFGKAKVSDKDAIQKFLDERYFDVSISQDSDHIFCSGCMQDLKSRDNTCEHSWPGGYDDKDRPILLLTDTHWPKEVSVVNDGANVTSTVLGISIEDAKESSKELFRATEGSIKGEEMVNYTILDLAYKQMLSTSGKSFTKETLADLSDEIFVGEDSTLPVYDEESAKILDSLIGSLKDEEAETLLREKLESKKAVITDCKRVFVERENKALKAKVQELEDSIKASEELQIKIKSLEDSSAQLNTEVEALKTKLADKEKDLLNSIKIIEDMKKEVTEENNETNSDSSVDKKEIDHKNEIMDKAGTVQSPSTTHTEVQVNKNELEDSNLTTTEKNIIKNYKTLLKDGNQRGADLYLANNKQYIRRSFDFKKLKGDN